MTKKQHIEARNKACSIERNLRILGISDAILFERAMVEFKKQYGVL